MKNFIQRVKSIATLIAFALFMSAPFSVHAVTAPPEISSEDMKMLEEIGKEVERYVNALPTESQLRAQGLSEEEIKKRETKEKFDAEVKRYSEMSEKQLLEEMEKVFSEASAQAPVQPQPEIEKPIYTQPVIQPEAIQEVKQVAPSDKQISALKLIDGVLSSISNFLNKAQIMVELPGKIPTWVKEGKLKNWPAGLNWNTFRGQVEELQVKLNKIKDRDPRSGSFKYLDDFIKDESLVNNLTKVRDSLSRNEPKIELSSGVDKMTTESRTAVRSVLLSLHEATSILAIPSALDKIIEKYEPTAKKIKESEEAAQKRALEESRRGRYPGGTSISAPPRERYEPIYGKGRESERYTLPSLEGPAKAAEKGSEALKPGDKGTGGKEGDKKADAAKAEEKTKREPEKKSESYEGDFLSGLEAFSDAIHESPNLINFEKHMKSGDPIDEDLIKEIPNATNGIKKASNAARKMKLQLGKLTDAQKAEYRKSFKNGYKDHKNSIDTLYNQVNNLSKPSQLMGSLPLGAANTNLIKSKYYAYYGKEYKGDLEAQLESKNKEIETQKSALEKKAKELDNEMAKSPVSKPRVDTLENEIKKIKDAIKKLENETKQIEEMLSKTSKPNLNDLKAKIQELKKTMDELG